jgi:hypothetical protein
MTIYQSIYSSIHLLTCLSSFVFPSVRIITILLAAPFHITHTYIYTHTFTTNVREFIRITYPNSFPSIKSGITSHPLQHGCPASYIVAHFTPGYLMCFASLSLHIKVFIKSIRKSTLKPPSSNLFTNNTED